MRRFLPVASLAIASLILTSTTPARASSDDGVLVLVAVAAFDLISLPYDFVMAVQGKPVDKGYATVEGWAGGIQAVGGAIGLGVCSGSQKCRSGAGLPALGVFTAWTSVMAIHGALSYDSGQSSHAARPPTALRVKVAPLAGDGRRSPAGIGVVGTF